MALPNWWEIVTPHKDIIDGNFNEAIFAADLGDVISGAAPLEYKDPVTFFKKTYLTNGLKNLLENVLSRLNGGKGDPVIQLQTPFGGGKTHALLTLYHTVKNYNDIKYLIPISDIQVPQNTKVAVFVGTQHDAVNGRTPWGEIAYQLGTYDIVKEQDIKRLSPGKDLINKMLGDNPTLILIDELAEYTVKAKDFAGQISAFSQEITEVAKSKNNCCLICTLPSSAPYGEEGERALNELQKIFGRLEAIYTPVEGIEIYEVVRTRLFDDLGKEAIRKKVAQSYFALYKKLGADVPPEVKETEYRDKIEHAYPFHPELIDVLYERWGSYPTFQRTRGVLRLLAEIVADLYNRKVSSPLIQSSLVNLSKQSIRREFVKHIGPEYDSVITSDIVGNAPKIDKEMGSEYKKYEIATEIATSIFIYSFGGDGIKGTTLPKIRVALLREGIQPTIVGDAISKLEDELWYLHSEEKQYAFRSEINLNRVIIAREEGISNDEVLKELRDQIQKNAGKSLEVYLWPENASDIPDNKKLKLVILSPDFPYKVKEKNEFANKKTSEFASEIFTKAGISFRVYKNTLFILAIDNNLYSNVSKNIKRFLALSSIQNDKTFFNSIPKERQDDLRDKLKAAEKEILFSILSAYKSLAILNEQNSVSWLDLGIPTVGMTTTISDRVKQYLEEQEKILRRVTPKFIIDKAFAKDENEKAIEDIYELFLKTPGLSLPEDENVILDATREGVANGVIGVKEGETVHYGEAITPSLSQSILRGEVAREIVAPKVAGTGNVNVGGNTIVVGGAVGGEVVKPLETPPKRVEAVKRLSFKAKIPLDEISSIIGGVILPLKEKPGSEVEITIEVKAESSEGFDKNTLENKVKETLKQIGAETVEWTEEK